MKEPKAVGNAECTPRTKEGKKARALVLTAVVPSGTSGRHDGGDA